MNLICGNLVSQTYRKAVLTWEQGPEKRLFLFQSVSMTEKKRRVFGNRSEKMKPQTIICLILKRTNDAR